ncbi:stalk domain-containing protein [Paenibacillus lautus]
MKKSAYVVGGILIGFVVATSTSAFADTVKSLIGKKVTGEYTVIVNGETLIDKGAVIDGRANVPVRGISEALGADIKVSNKTITITNSGSEEMVQPSNGDNNGYNSWSKADLENRRTTLLERILEPTKAERNLIAKDLEVAKSEGAEVLINSLEKQLAVYDADIAKYTAELKSVEAALAAAK